MIIDRAASGRDKFLRPEKKRPGQEIPDRGALHIMSLYQCVFFYPGRCLLLYFFPEETDMRKKSMPKTKKMAMEATP